MLKIKLNNPEQSETLIRLVQRFVRDDRAFIAGATEIGDTAVESIRQLSDVETLWVIKGIDQDEHRYQGILASLKPLNGDTRGTAHIESLLTEKPFYFKSVEAATEIWPHATLEDRVTDVVLFALAGYRVPATAEIAEGE
jgi:hypothetical protein